MSGTSDLESRIEAKASEYAKSLGMLTLKLNVRGQVGWPDRLYVYRGGVMFIEYKAAKETPRAIQLEIHDKLRRHNIRIFVCDNLIAARCMIWRFKEEQDALHPA